MTEAASPRSNRKRIVFVHVGTHKTGSTAIQYFLSQNEATLAAAGVYVPRTGRLAEHAEGCGHHNIAFELTGSWTYHPPNGSLTDLVAEVAAAGFPRACISSEEFEVMYAKPDQMRRLQEAFAAVGYDVKIVLYLRPQVDYIESLYAEIVKAAWFLDFPAVVQRVLEHQELAPGSVTLSYERLIAAFAAIFGPANIIVRPYRQGADPLHIQREFARIIGLSERQFAACTFTVTQRINTRLTFAGTVAALTAAGQSNVFNPALHGLDADIACQVRSVDGPFHPMQPREIARVARRFAGQNLRLSLRYRAVFGCVSVSRFRRAVGYRLAPDRTHQRQRRLLEAIVERMNRRRASSAALASHRPHGAEGRAGMDAEND